jgi:O-antigen/teichoic acid export membrane protein
MNESSLHRDFVWTFVGNAIYYACQWLLVVILAKLGSPEAVGDYVLGVAVCAPVMLLTNLQLRALLASDIRHEYSFGQYLRFRIWSLAGALVCVAVICVISHLSWHTSRIVVLIAFGMALEILGELYYGLMQKNDRMNRIALSLMMKGPASALAVGVAMQATHSVAWAAAALAGARGIVWLFYDRRLVRTWLRADGQSNSISAARRAKPFTSLVRTSGMLGVILMIGSLNANTPRYFIRGVLNSHELGIFSALASLLGVGNMLMAAIGQSSFLRISRAYTNNDGSAFRVLVLRMVGVAALAGCCAIAAAFFAGPALLSIIFRPEYAKYSSLFIWLITAGCIGYVTYALGIAMTAARCFALQIPLLLVTAGVTALCCRLLIPAHGLIGGAQASLIGNLVHLAGAVTILFVWTSRLRSPANTTELTMPAPVHAES